MKTLAYIAATVAILVDLAAWVGLVVLSWIAAAPGHTVESNRAGVLFGVAFLLLFPVGGALFWVSEERDR